MKKSKIINLAAGQARRAIDKASECSRVATKQGVDVCNQSRALEDGIEEMHTARKWIDAIEEATE